MYPARKYEREDGGPGAVDVVAVLREHMPPGQARLAVESFFRALAYNWVIYGPDAHAKNYSLLLAGPDVRLAPLYDISSIAPYPDRYDLRTMAMAMAVNGRYQNNLVTDADWRALATRVELDPDEVVGWVYYVVSHAPDALADVVRDEPTWVADLDMTRQLISGVAANSRSLLRWLDPPSVTGGKKVAATTRRPGKPTVASYRKADGTWVSSYRNPRYRG